MNLLLLNESLETAFATAKKMENAYPEGEWLNFDASSGGQALGLYLTNSDEVNSDFSDFITLKAHKEFLKHFLGLFTPSLDSKISIYNAKGFTDFCIHLNDCLNKNLKIYDLSRTKLWIWYEKNEKDQQYEIPKKLKNYLDFI